MNKYRRLIIIILVLVVMAGLAYRFVIARQAKKLATAIVKRGDLEQTLTISGQIDAEEKATLKFQTSGRLAWVGVKQGDYVKKYQAIASLDQRELQKKLDKYLNDYLKSRWDFEQTKKDYKDTALTDAIKTIIDKAQFDLNKSVLDVEIQDLALKFAHLNTPIAGIVTKVESPYAGVNITPADAEFEIVNPQTIFFAALADQTETTQLSKAMKGKLTLDSFPDQSFDGRIKTISFTPQSGETGTVYLVKFIFPIDNKQEQFRLGMTGDLTFITNKKQAVLYLPLKFIRTDQQGQEYVRVKKNGRLIQTPVTTGMETDNFIEITSPLTEGIVVYD